MSYGVSHHGLLQGGAALPDRGEGFVRARPGEDTRWGAARLVDALTRAAERVARRWPGGAPLRIGDLSSRHGGAHSRHRSHRTGRDADVIFYATDLHGRSVQGRGWLRYDRFGLARETSAPGGRASGQVFRLDEARNWELVRSLLSDPALDVQWIFCSTGVKARLLQYAAAHEAESELVVQASYVLHEPSRGLRHDDHFHIRIACSPEEIASGCRDEAPIWPWLSSRKPPFAPPAEPLGDAALIAALLGDEAQLASR